MLNRIELRLFGGLTRDVRSSYIRRCITAGEATSVVQVNLWAVLEAP